MEKTLILLVTVAMSLGGCGASLGGVLTIPIDGADALYLMGFTLWATALFQSPNGKIAALVIGMGLFFAACTPTPAYALDMKRLREVICVRESRHLNSPVLAIGDGGESRGECQVSINTAQWITPHAINHGFVPAYLRTVSKDAEAFKWFLHYGPINRGLADAYLDKIKRGLGAQARSVERIAYFWNAGHNSDGSKSESWAFAAEVRIMYLGPPRASAKR